MNRSEFYYNAVLHAPLTPPDFHVTPERRSVRQTDGTMRVKEIPVSSLQRDIAWRKHYATALTNATFGDE